MSAYGPEAVASQDRGEPFPKQKPRRYPYDSDSADLRTHGMHASRIVTNRLTPPVRYKALGSSNASEAPHEARLRCGHAYLLAVWHLWESSGNWYFLCSDTNRK